MRLARSVLCVLSVTLLACGSSSEQGGIDAAPPPPDAAPPPPPPPSSGMIFESGPVRPVALSADGQHLYVTNIPDGHLEILRVGATALTLEASVPVGVDPVTVAVRSPTEVWVVNQVSDSVSIVDVGAAPPRVTRTLLVGDEPSDLVFAGAGKNRAFITTAHRGQRRTDAALSAVPGAGDPQLTTAGVGRADVWVFDATALGADAGGVPVAIVTFAGDTPRALAVSPDGATVYAAVFKSGNQTTVTNPLLSCSGFDNDSPCTVNGTTVPGGPIGPGTNHAGIAAPRIGTIVKQDSLGAWKDAKGRDWSTAIKFNLPDQDVFSFDAASLAPGATAKHVGTTLFNMAVNPVSGTLYISNSESRNDLRFEGPGIFTAGKTLQGHIAEVRITHIDSGGVHVHHLNKHIDYATRPAPAGVKDHSLSTPLDMAVSSDGNTLYVAAFGSGKVGVFSVSALEGDTYDPTTDSANYLAVTGGGPGGLALDDTNHRLFVATRFDDGVSMINLTTKAEVHVTLHTPEPTKVIAGRPFLYDAVVSSSNGEASCASCHMFGDADHLSWDLGNPDGDPVTTPINIKLGVGAPTNINGTGMASSLHPMKGPMGTQTLRGMVNHGAMHWRGDRVSGFFGTDTHLQPPFDSELAFKNFIVAFPGLVGRDSMISPAEMQSYADFTLAIVMPPNPIRALDNSLTAAQQRGRDFYMGCDGMDSIAGGQAVCMNGRPMGLGHFADGAGIATFGFTCEGCHTLRPDMGFFGTDGQFSFEALPQIMKIPQLRNLYDKVGMFGMAANPAINAGDNGAKGDQIRGFGFENEASTDTLFRFFQARVFNSAQAGLIGFTNGDPQRRDVEQFMLAYDTDLAPVVGQQITLSSTDNGSAGARVDLLIARAGAPFVSKVLGPGATECDLVVRGVVAGSARAYRLRPDGKFDTDGAEAPLTAAALKALAATPGQALTFTCFPPGWGPRALDRDLDGFKNAQDACPADPACH